MGDAAVEDDVQGAPPAGPKRASSHRRRSTEFLRGACRAPYKRAWNLDDAREGSGDDDEQSEGERDAGVSRAPQSKKRKCQCLTVLAIHVDSFKAMKHTGAHFKKLEKRYGDKENGYTDFTRQNTWLLNNVFDSHGNYLYCRDCVRKSLGVNKKRLARVRRQKIEGETTAVHG